MHSADLLLLALKMGLSAIVVVTASLTIERVGPMVGAMIASLPISAGPAYVFLAMEHGPAFIEASTVASFPGVIATAAFQLAYVKLAQRWRMVPALAGTLAAWAVAIWASAAAGWDFAVLAPLSIGCFGVAYLLVRPHLAWRVGAVARRRRWDIPLRAAAVMIVTGAAVLAGRLAGPGVAGLVALMPVVFTSLVLVLQPRIGGPNTAAVLANAVPGMAGFNFSLCFLHLAVVPLGSVVALSLSLLICMLWNLALLLWRRRVAV
jgi:hypothetical protein